MGGRFCLSSTVVLQICRGGAARYIFDIVLAKINPAPDARAGLLFVVANPLHIRVLAYFFDIVLGICSGLLIVGGAGATYFGVRSSE